MDTNERIQDLEAVNQALQQRNRDQQTHIEALQEAEKGYKEIENHAMSVGREALAMVRDRVRLRTAIKLQQEEIKALREGAGLGYDKTIHEQQVLKVLELFNAEAKKLRRMALLGFEDNATKSLLDANDAQYQNLLQAQRVKVSMTQEAAHLKAKMEELKEDNNRLKGAQGTVIRNPWLSTLRNQPPSR